MRSLSVTFRLMERYEVILPWQDRAMKMPDYYMLSHSRLNGLMCRLRKRQKFLKSVVNASVDLYLIIKSRNQQYDIEQLLIKELRESEGR